MPACSPEPGSASAPSFQSVTSSSRAARRSPLAALSAPARRGRALRRLAGFGGAKEGGLRRRQCRPCGADGDHGRAGPRTGEPRRRPPLAPGPLVSRTRTRVERPHEARPSTAALVRVLVRPGRAARAESAGGAPRRTARWRPRPPSCRCVWPGCWAVGGSLLCAGEPGPVAPERSYRTETGASRASSPAGRTARWGRAPLPTPMDLGHFGPSFSASCPGPASLDFRWSPPGA